MSGVPLLDDPWLVDPARFAALRSSAERLRFLVNYAVLAPSGHNTQPWIFRVIGEQRLDLRAGRSRALAIVDPDDPALVISCGAALANLRLAAGALGLALAVEVLPEPGDPDTCSLAFARSGLGPLRPTGRCCCARSPNAAPRASPLSRIPSRRW
jgi:hypothetical protein